MILSLKFAIVRRRSSNSNRLTLFSNQDLSRVCSLGPSVLSFGLCVVRRFVTDSLVLFPVFELPRLRRRRRRRRPRLRCHCCRSPLIRRLGKEEGFKISSSVEFGFYFGPESVQKVEEQWNRKELYDDFTVVRMDEPSDGSFVRSSLLPSVR